MALNYLIKIINQPFQITEVSLTHAIGQYREFINIYLRRSGWIQCLGGFSRCWIPSVNTAGSKSLTAAQEELFQPPSSWAWLLCLEAHSGLLELKFCCPASQSGSEVTDENLEVGTGGYFRLSSFLLQIPGSLSLGAAELCRQSRPRGRELILLRSEWTALP